MPRSCLLILLLAFVALLPTAARADEIVLVSGKVLQGAIIERREDHIVLNLIPTKTPEQSGGKEEIDFD